MKKYALLPITFLLMLAAADCFAFPVARPPEKQRYLGQDHVNMLWYILDYGEKEDGTPFGVARRYYTNLEIKQHTAELLMDKFGYSAEFAGSLYFTEYEFEYTEDGQQFATTYLGHYDMLGNEIHGTVYDDSSEDTQKVFVPLDPNHASGRALALTLPPPAPAPRRR